MDAPPKPKPASASPASAPGPAAPAALSPAAPPAKMPRGASAEFSLSSIRDALIRMEETIIFAMIERAQWARNARAYVRGEGQTIAPEGGADSFFEHFLYETEKLHAKLGRYRAQDLEHAFFAHRDLPSAALSRSPAEPWGKPLKPNAVNLNAEILERYERDVVALLAPKDEEDGHFGSTALADIALIQALSYRIHYGKLVAEAKFRANTGVFSELIRKQDADGIMRELTDERVEKAVLDRVRAKAARYARPTDAPPGTGDLGDPYASGYKVDPEVIMAIYRDVVIPLNKKVQVAYLLLREDAGAQ